MNKKQDVAAVTFGLDWVTLYRAYWPITDQMVDSWNVLLNNKFTHQPTDDEKLEAMRNCISKFERSEKAGRYGAKPTIDDFINSIFSVRLVKKEPVDQAINIWKRSIQNALNSGFDNERLWELLCIPSCSDSQPWRGMDCDDATEIQRTAEEFIRQKRSGWKRPDWITKPSFSPFAIASEAVSNINKEFGQHSEEL